MLITGDTLIVTVKHFQFLIEIVQNAINTTSSLCRQDDCWLEKEKWVVQEEKQKENYPHTAQIITEKT